MTDEYESGHPPVKQPLFSRVGTMAGMALSLFVVLLVGWYAFRLGTRDASTVPVIKAIEGDIRTASDATDGDVEGQGREVNGVLEGNPPELPNNVTLAPSAVSLAGVDPVDPNMVEVEVMPTADPNALTGAETGNQTATLDDEEFITSAGDIAPIQTPIKRPELLYIPPKETMNPATAEALPVGQTDAAPNVPVASAIEATTPTTAASGDAELGPRLESGSALIQLAANTNIEDTQAQWEKFKALHADVLGDKNLYVEKKVVNGKLWYRLRVSGFADGAATKAACATLLERNVQCLTVRAE